MGKLEYELNVIGPTLPVPARFFFAADKYSQQIYVSPERTAQGVLELCNTHKDTKKWLFWTEKEPKRLMFGDYFSGRT